MFDTTETTIRAAVEWLRLVVETLGALVVGIGIVVVIVGLVRHMVIERHQNFTKVRLTFARYLALALELQLAADILSTSIAPSWDQIGKLAAVAVIRTALNYFLMMEIQTERQK
jgi:uncharacterized membrane protein